MTTDNKPIFVTRTESVKKTFRITKYKNLVRVADDSKSIHYVGYGDLQFVVPIEFVDVDGGVSQMFMHLVEGRQETDSNGGYTCHAYVDLFGEIKRTPDCQDDGELARDATEAILKLYVNHQ